MITQRDGVHANLFKAIEPVIEQSQELLTYKQLIKDEFWIAQNILSKVECQTIIKEVEEVGFKQALVSLGDGPAFLIKSIRDCQRVVIYDPELAKYLYKQCNNFLPIACEGALRIGVNDGMRFLKYDHEGAWFSSHYDCEIPVSENQKSLITYQIYLNDGFEGGKTTFYDPTFETGKYEHNPELGQAIFFRQAGWKHEGSAMKSGVKYTLLTDIVFKWISAEDTDKFQHQSCPVCKTMTRFIKLKSCNHPFLCCQCNPLSINPKVRFCRQCDENIIMSDDIEQEFSYLRHAIGK